MTEPQAKPFERLSAAAPAIQVYGNQQTMIHGINYDSRKVGPGDLFVALPGSYVDGHDYIVDARRRGASAVLVERYSSAVQEFACWALVPNTREALASLAATFYGHPGQDLGVIGVTGTDGKTTTSYFIDSVLRTNGLQTGLVGTVAVRIGDSLVEHDTRQTTPESLDLQQLLSEMSNHAVDWAVLEATSHALALYRLDNCPFDIGVVTNVTREHLDFHGDIHAYRQAKARLLERVRDREPRRFPAGVVLNADDDGCVAISTRRGETPTIWYSVRPGVGDIRAEGIEERKDGVRFMLWQDTDRVDVQLRLIGRYNVQNALAAAGVGLLCGLSLEEIADGLQRLTMVPGRLQRIDLGQPFAVFVDYAHTPAAIRETLRLVRNVTRGKMITVFGSAGERDRGKRSLQGRVSVELADLSIFTSEDPRFEDPMEIIDEIAQGAADVGAQEGRDYFRIEDRREAIRFAMSIARPNDSVVLAGKGHEQCMIYGDQRRPWNEAEEARVALRQRGYATEPERPGRT